MASDPNPTEDRDPFWPVTFRDVEDARPRTALAATPAQRLAWAEERIEFDRLAADVRAESATKPD